MKMCPNCKEDLILDHNYGNNGEIISTLICENCDYEEHDQTISKEEADKIYLESMYEEDDCEIIHTTKEENLESIFEKYGEDELERFINRDYSGECKNLKQLKDLKSLTTEEIQKFIDEYEEFLDATTLSDEEQEDWESLSEYINKD
ncbi:MAG: hypothetical protein ACRCXT_10475 [Paraclostridium sp.]